MKNKGLYYLMGFTTLSFLMLAGSALFFSSFYFRCYDKQEKANQASQLKFETFVQNVESGKWQLTTEKWIEGMKLERAEAEAEYQEIVPLIEHLQSIGWFSLILAACNILVALYVKDKVRSRQDGSLCEEPQK